MTSLDGINGRSIQTLLRGENDSKQSDEFQATFYPDSYIFMSFEITQVYLRSAASRVCKGHLQNEWVVKPFRKNPKSSKFVCIKSSLQLACEQALLFGRASRERASEGPKKGELATISHKFHFHPGNPGTLQSVKTVTANVPQIRKVKTACQI